jgi:uncharacterized membrane protein
MPDGSAVPRGGLPCRVFHRRGRTLSMTSDAGRDRRGGVRMLGEFPEHGAGRPGARGRAGDQRRLEQRRNAVGRRREEARRREKDIDRVAFFSDAIFAIAITLLVLRISVPARGIELGPALAERWPSFLAFVISFWVIGRYWLMHHRLFRFVRDYDTLYIGINLFLMLCICFLPYPTDLLALHQEDPLSVVLYAGTVVVTGLASQALWTYARRHDFLDHDLTTDEFLASRVRGLLVIAVFAVSIPLAFVDTTVAMLFWAANALQVPVEHLVMRRRAKSAKAVRGPRRTARELVEGETAA